VVDSRSEVNNTYIVHRGKVTAPRRNQSHEKAARHDDQTSRHDMHICRSKVFGRGLVLCFYDALVHRLALRLGKHDRPKIECHLRLFRTDN
jgi:hypothetical protein